MHRNHKCLFLPTGISLCLGQVNKAVCREEDMIVLSFVPLCPGAVLQSAAIKRQGEYLFFCDMEKVSL